MTKKDIHVVPRDSGWAVKKEGNERASSLHDTKDRALDHARDQARRERVEVVIHKKDGKIQDSDSYGRDPFPPRDQKR